MNESNSVAAEAKPRRGSERGRPIDPPEPNLTPEAMVARARELVPRLRERAEEADRLRTLPPETYKDFLDAGFYRILQPRRFGGYEFDLRTFCDVMIEITRGCGSSGWVLCLTAAHVFHMAGVSEEGQIEMYGDDGDFRAPMTFAPQGTATPVDGGYRINGRWNYNSGGDYANWLGVSAVVPGDTAGGPPRDTILAYLRQEECEVCDNWFVMGLRGTGSKQAIIEDVFVPERRVLSQLPWFAGRAPGYGVHENPFYRTSPFDVFLAELACICVGLAESAIDAFYERAMTKVNSYPPFTPVKNERSVQRLIGLARAKTDAAQAVLQRIIDAQKRRMEQIAQSSPVDVTEEETRRTFMLAHQTLHLAREAVEPLFDASGTSAAQTGQPMERIFRDLNMVRTHYMMNGDRTAENWGATFFGQEAYSLF